MGLHNPTKAANKGEVVRINRTILDALRIANKNLKILKRTLTAFQDHACQVIGWRHKWSSLDLARYSVANEDLAD